MGVRFLDQYSLLHSATGVLAYFWNFGFVFAVLLHVIFEILENSKQGVRIINRFAYWPGGKPKADSFRNQMGDNLSFALGWLIAYGTDLIGSQRDWYPAHLTSSS